MKVFLNSNFQIEKIEDKAENTIVQGSEDFDEFVVYIPSDFKETFTSIAPTYSVKRADDRICGEYATFGVEFVPAVTGYYGWKAKFNPRDLAVKGALEITISFIATKSGSTFKKRAASIITHVNKAVDTYGNDVLVLNASNIESMLESLANALLEMSGKAALNDEQQTITASTINGTLIKQNGNKVLDKSYIVDNLTTYDSTKVLSAKQGKVLKDLINAINSVLASNDSSLDTMQEIVNFIKTNRENINVLTNNKVNVSDVINSFDSNATNKPLSAYMGKVLRGFITELANYFDNFYAKTETYSKQEINSLISTGGFEVVQTLPQSNIRNNIIYLVPSTSGETGDIYDEYIYVNGSWESLGTTNLDLTNYYNKSEADALLAEKVDKVEGKGLSTNDYTNADKDIVNSFYIIDVVGTSGTISQIGTDIILNSHCIVRYKVTSNDNPMYLLPENSGSSEWTFNGIDSFYAKIYKVTISSNGNFTASSLDLAMLSDLNGLATESYVNTQINNLPKPMIFKGTLGVGGTIATLPTASSSNAGYTYKVIVAGTYASQHAEIGDLFISDGSTWVYVPSADDDDGILVKKALYNLGSFDTYPYNNDATKVLRGTGYVDLGTLNWAYNASLQAFYADTANIKGASSDSSTDFNAVCSKYEKSYINNVVSNHTKDKIFAINNSGTIYIYDTSYTDANIFKASLQGVALQAELKDAYQYVEDIIPDVPLLDLPQSGCQFLREEWQKGLNLFDINKAIINYGVLVTNGELYAQNGLVSSDYIEIKPNTTYSNNFVRNFSSGLGVVFYDSSKTFISAYSSSYETYNTFVTPSNAKYLRICYDSSTTSNPMLNEGSHPEPYQPFYGGLVREKDITPVLLWENGNIGSFADEILTLSNMASYKFIVVAYEYDDSNDYGIQYAKFKVQVGKKYIISMNDCKTGKVNSREFTIDSNTQITFDYDYDEGQSSSTGFIIPIAIYGTNLL